MTTAKAARYSEILLSPAGAIRPNTAVEVRLPNTTTKAILYSDENKTATVANPVTTDALGNLSFWADWDSHYDLFSVETTIEDVALTPSHAALTGTLARSGLVGIDITDTVYGAVGDGVADDSAALTAALAAGPVVIVPPRVTLLVGDVVVSGKAITGGGTIKKKSASPSALHLQGEGPTVRGMRFAGELASAQPNSDIKLGEGATNIVIEGNVFAPAGGTIYSAIAAAVDSKDAGGTPYTTRVSGVLIANNRFRAGSATARYTRPLFLHSVDNLTITGNIFRDCNYDAIRLRENDGYVTITNNQFIDIGDPAWADEQTRDALDTFWSGARLTITNNIVRTTASFGFEVKGADAAGVPLRRIIIANNQISGCRYSGIQVGGHPDYDGLGNYAFVDSVIIDGNIIEDCNRNNAGGLGSIDNGGIRLKGLVKYATVSNNIVVSNFGRGIHVHNNEASKDACRNIKVLDNLCINNGYSGVLAAGIHVTGTSWVDIVGNTCENDSSLPNPTQAYGIYTSSSVDGFGYTPTAQSISIESNTCRGNTTQDIQIDANNTRATAIGSYRDNKQTLVHRVSWQQQRNLFHGQGVPAAGDGNFRQGDIILNTAAAASGFVGWVCVTAGNPGTWKTFGVISA